MRVQHQHRRRSMTLRSVSKCGFIFLVVVSVLTACGRTDAGTYVRSEELRSPISVPQDTSSLAISTPSARTTNLQQTVPAQVISTPQPDLATALALIASVTPVDADYNAQEKDLIANLRRELDRPNISPEARKAIQEKIDVIQRQVQARAYGRLHPAPKETPQSLQPPVVAPAQPTPTPLTGILNDFSPPFPAAQFTVANMWQDVVNGRLVHVYAGARGDDPSQGAVIVQTDGVDGPAGNFDLATPVKAGAVRIVAANGTKLTLQAKNGATFMFDVLARTLQQVSS